MLVALNGVWIALLCGMFCLRFRDVTQLVTSLIQISMLITPIFWPPDSLSGNRRLIFVETNPLYHMVDIVRAPLLGKLPGITSYVVVVVITSAGGIWPMSRCAVSAGASHTGAEFRMARVVLENVRVDFPIYGAQRNLRKVLFDRATGGLI